MYVSVTLSIFHQDFNNIVVQLDSEKLSTLWSTCHLYVAESILNIVQPKDDQNPDTFGEALETCIKLANVTIEHTASNSIPEGLILTVKLLNKTLPSLSQNHKTLKENISKVCELWFTKEFIGKEELAINVLKYLIEKAVLSNGTVSF